MVTTGTGRATEPWNGLGGVWNVSWTDLGGRLSPELIAALP